MKLPQVQKEISNEIDILKVERQQRLNIVQDLGQESSNVDAYAVEAELRVLAEQEVRSHYVNEVCPYSKLTREYGSGRIRLGSFLGFRDDMYALMFASNFKMKWVFKYRNELKEKAEAAEEKEILEERMLDEFRTGRTNTTIPSPKKKGLAYGFDEVNETPILD